MKLPKGLHTDKVGLVCKLNRSFYSLRQTSRQRYAKLTEALNSRGFTHSMHDYSLFYKKFYSSSIFMVVNVDDVLITGTDT